MRTLTRGTRGQTSAEYLGALLLVVAIVIVIVTTGAGSSIRDGIRCAVTEITGGTCEGAQTESNGEPLISECVRNSSQRGIAGSVRIAAIDIGGGVDGIKEVRADGTVKVTIKGNAKAGLNWGVDVGIKAGDMEAGVGAGGRAGVTASVARGWVFENEGDADHFISDVKKKVGAMLNPLPNFPGTKDDADIKLPPHDESTIQGGLELRSKAGATGIETLERNISAALGRTVNTNTGTPDEGDKTYYFEGAVRDDPGHRARRPRAGEAAALQARRVGSAQAQARVHRRQERPAEDPAPHRPARRDRGRRRLGEPQGLPGTNYNTVLDRLTKRKEAQNGELGGRAIIDFKLDLTDPANRDAAEGFIHGRDSSGAPVSRMSSMLDLGGRLLTDSTFNARFYTLAKHKTSAGFNAGVFGVSGEYTTEDANLVDAFYRPAGGDTFGFQRWDTCVH